MRGLEEPAHASRVLEELFLQLCCCVSFWFWREIGSFFVVVGNYYYDRKKKVQSSVWQVLNHYYDQKKIDTVVCLAGAQSLLRPEKKDTSLLRPEKKRYSRVLVQLEVNLIQIR